MLQALCWRLERVYDLLMGVRARLRAVCVVANPRNSQAIAVVCASQPIPNRIPHTFIRDHEHILRTRSYAAAGVPGVVRMSWRWAVNTRRTINTKIIATTASDNEVATQKGVGIFCQSAAVALFM